MLGIEKANLNNYYSRHWGVVSKVKLLRLSITINFTKDEKKDNISQLGDYDVTFCEQQYMHRSYYISLLKFKSFGQLIKHKNIERFTLNSLHNFEISN